MKEYESWRSHDVFDLVDTRKFPAKNYVTGRWLLTIKRDTDGNIENARHDGYFVVSKIDKRGISRRIRPPHPARDFAYSVNLLPPNHGIYVIWI